MASLGLSLVVEDEHLNLRMFIHIGKKFCAIGTNLYDVCYCIHKIRLQPAVALHVINKFVL